MAKDNLNWGDLKYFLEVARKTRLLSAGKHLGVNHTTVSRRISALEHALQAQLFEKDESGFSLTTLGESILPIAQQIEDAIALTRERAQENSSELRGKIRLGIPDGFGNSFLAERMHKFTSQNPEVKLEYLAMPLTHNIFKREVDMAISLEPVKRQDVLCKKITDYTLYLYTSPQFIEQNDVDIEDLASIKQFPFAAYIRDILFTDVLDFNQLIGKNLKENFSASTIMSQYHFIRCGGGFGVLPYFMVENDPRFVKVLPDKINFTRTYWLLTPIDLARLSAYRAMDRFMMSEAKIAQNLFLPTQG